MNLSIQIIYAQYVRVRQGKIMDQITVAESAKLFIPMYIDSAKVYMQLAMATIVATVVFHEKITDVKLAQYRDWALIGSWIMLLLCIGTSALYQYVAIERMMVALESPLMQSRIPRSWIYAAGRMYAFMMITFYIGAILFVVSAAKQILRKKS